MKILKTILFTALAVLVVQSYSQSTDSIKTKPFQLSLIYPLGTEGIATKDFAYSTSINAFLGISKGIEGFEASGFTNITRGNVRGVQLGGFANIVSGDVKGVQSAGFTNVNKGNFKGTQMSGFANINNETFKGVQIAGFTNVNKGDCNGLQLSGFTNVSPNSLEGSQIAGFANVADTVKHQVSGFVNVAKYVKGYQIGFINIADSVERTPIGFLSFVRNGYNKFEIETGETFYLTVNGKVGTKKFYNIFTLGVKPTSDQFIWTFGYGFGKQLFEKEKLAMNLDLTFGQINEGEIWTKRMNLFNQMKINFSYQVNSKFAIYGGPTLNYYLQEKTDEFGNSIIITEIPTLEIFNKTDNYYKHSIALGFNLGVRF